MTAALRDLLATRPVLLADGAMGTNLFAQGLEAGGAPELWNLEHPERVMAVHRGFALAGSDLLLTNSFGANRYRLKLHGAQAQVAEINRAAVQVARAAIAEAGRPVLVAGSIGPSGEIFEPYGSLSRRDGEAAFAEQAAALAEAGCDLLWIETISAAEELQAAVAGAARTSLPIVATMTFDTAGRTMMGLTPAAAIALRDQLPVPLAGFGANCGIGPGQLVETVVELARASAPDDLLVAKGNCGVPRYEDGQIRYDGTPEVMAAYACLARDAGARIIGGCCGTTADHLRAMADGLQRTPKGAVPDRAAIEQALGPLATGDEPPARGRRGRRRARSV